MNCPVCNRSLAPTLSICFACGTMVHDSVREELQTKIGTGSIQKKIQVPAPIIATPKMDIPATPKPKPVRTITTELNRQKTSPTLVEFQTKNATLPDWRLQLQNAVRHRKNGPTDSESAGNGYQAQLVTNGANALKVEYIEETIADKQIEYADQRVANALKRIDNSRKKFLPETNNSKTATAKTSEPRNYPFNVVSRNAEPAIRTQEMKASVNVPPKPRLVPTVTFKKTGYDTNKLPPLSVAAPVSSLDMPVAFVIDEPIKQEPVKREIRVEMIPEAPQVVEEAFEHEVEVESDEIDDLAPFATRFNAGLFDLIIGLFASLLILSPIAFAGGDWMSGAGVLALAGTCAIVMFLYLTLSLALFGRTAGMKMFSLELVDADLNEYPSFHQAAVSSAVYLLTLPLAGVGFLTVLFNDEKRAAHDLLSGTIIVTEF
jgi:uncharacterized RDD family membrane protein YckC